MSVFSTTKFKQLVGYAIRGAGFDKFLELTTYIGVTVSDGMLYLNTTDGTNYLSVSDECVSDNFDVTVNAELFSKIISKITTDTVEIDVEGNSLVVRGNGKYTLDIITDESGAPLSFPDKFPSLSEEVIGTISAVDLVAIDTTLKASLSTVLGTAYTNYYFGDAIVSTDKIMMGKFNRKIFDTPYLLNKELVDLMVMSGSDVTVSRAGDMLITISDISGSGTISVCTKANTDVSDFNIEGVNKFSQIETKSFCRVRKAELIDLLDRLSLFVGKFDNETITIHFSHDKVEVSSLKSNGVESVDVVESKDAVDTTIRINITRLLRQLKSYNSDMVDIYYGSEVCIKLVDGDMTQVIALIK